jgi:hypothetical protein
MTRTTNARIAGFTFLFYIAVALPGVVLMNRAAAAEGTVAKLARIAAHASDVRVSIVLALLSCFAAVVLAVTLYGITRNEDHELAVLVMACRVAEGVLGAVGIPNTLGLLWLATAGPGASAPDAATTQALGAYFLMPAQSTMLGAPFFAAGSLVFSWLLLRGRLVPAPLAWMGVLASALLVLGLPLQIAGFLTGPITASMWLPMLAFEVPLGLWLLARGVPPPPRA